ncbi:Rieske 2Fe-2S domain-containing protein, partial [Herbaspirillum sp. B65]|uniref:Rieske 2Fe-2S domain-containing protein n=1 Tax=Herbaspirillum sp. B65 TaxID=137708 RepID=UPI0020908160
MNTTAADKYQDVERLLESALDEDATNGIFRCRRDIFTNEELFELEMKHLFESNWVYLAHESQIPEINDYYTTWIGRQPVVITRDKTGELHAVINACAHKGAMLCRRKHGNKSSFTCPFHGWTFSNSGKLLKVKDEKTTEYPVSFNQNGLHRYGRQYRQRRRATRVGARGQRRGDPEQPGGTAWRTGPSLGPGAQHLRDRLCHGERGPDLASLRSRRQRAGLLRPG